MNEQKNGVLADQSNNTPIQATQAQPTQVVNSITQSVSQGQVQAKQKRDRAFSRCRVLAVGRATYTLAIKFYDEQIKNQDVQAVINAVKALPQSEYHALMICHYKDEQNDGVWLSALEKKHYHLIVRMVDSKKTFRVGTMLQRLNIEFRKGLDENILVNGALETVGDFSAYATYLTHDTQQAIIDGKMRYKLDEIVSNLDIDEIKQVRNGYIRLCPDMKPTSDDMILLDAKAFDLGYDLMNFDEWYDSLNFFIRSHAKMKTIRESYLRGVNKRVAEQTQVLRVCIFIQGEPNTGKTYTSKKALGGKRIYTVSGGGSGKFDNLRADHEAIVIDDDICPNLLNMSDNYICRAYKRNKDNPVWSGQYLIITSNLTFIEYLESCGIKVGSSDRCYNDEYNGHYHTKHYQAILSRFFVCKVMTFNGVNRLVLSKASTRGTVEEQLKRVELFKEFRDRFDEIAKEYQYTENTVDYSDIEETTSINLGFRLTKKSTKYDSTNCPKD